MNGLREFIHHLTVAKGKGRVTQFREQRTWSCPILDLNLAPLLVLHDLRYTTSPITCVKMRKMI